ncbi:MAG: hypothetical protein IPK60_23055 [Sandaracinaceae bacterium]|nr:hypothetical protein [Sandaracinaceae bacterium]
MPTEAIEYRISITGGEEAARVLSTIEAATAKSNKASQAAAAIQKPLAAATAATNAQVQAASVRFNTFQSTLGLTGQALGRVNPALGRTVSVIGQASGVIQTLTSAGLGPMGLAIGAVSAAAGILIPLMSDTADAAETAGDNFEDAATKLGKYVAAARTAREASEQARRDANNDIDIDRASGLLTEAQAEAATAEQRVLAAQALVARTYTQNGAAARAIREVTDEQAASFIRQGLGVGRSIIEAHEAQRQLDAAVARVQERSGVVQGIAAQDAFNDPRAVAPAGSSPTTPTRRSGGGGNSAASAREAFEQRMREMEVDRQIAELRAQEVVMQTRITKERERQVELSDRLLAQADAEIEAADALRDKLAAEREAQKAAEREFREATGKGASGEEKNAKDLEHMQEMSGAIQEFGNNSIAAFEAAANSGLGAGAAAQQFFKTISADLAKQALGKAVFETAEGIAALASVYGAGLAPGHFAAAAAFGSAAAAFGVVSAAIPSAPATPSTNGPSTSSRPETGSGSGGSGSEGRTIIVKFGGGVVTALTEAELGRRIGRMVDRGDTRLGRG